MKGKYIFLPLLLVLCFLLVGSGQENKTLTIIHTNDMHSQFLGLYPNKDYTPMTTGDDETVGGWARIAAEIKKQRDARSNPVLVLDAGDFLMGSLFHMISREEAAELCLMKDMGYDLTTLGNHEFDLKPEGLSRILESAERKGKIPGIVASNVVFSKESTEDDALEKDFENGLVKPYVVLEKDGMKIGFFGLIGKDAAEVAPFADPVTFSDQIETALKMVQLLRETEKVDLVICLSHSGLNDDKKKSEDEVLAAEVPGIDVIVSGHTHTNLPEPIVVGKTIIVQAWEYGKILGVLDLAVGPDGVTVEKYTYIPMDDTIMGDAAVNNTIGAYEADIDRGVLAPYGLSFFKTVAQSDFDMVLKEEEVALGNMVTDSLRWAVDGVEYDPADPSSRVSISIQSNGLIRNDILMGKTGDIAATDLFNVVPLGIGSDGTMAYPLVTFYLYGSEIKKAMEVPTSIYPLKGSDYFLQFSGLKVTYNPHRMIFDRVTEILIEDENGNYVPLDWSDDNKTLYKITSNYYNSTFIKVVGNFTNNILTMVPKDREGKPIEDLTEYRVDADPNTPGIQEMKDWTALTAYVATFEDTDGDGTPNIPERYREPAGRYVAAASWNPVKLIAHGSYLTWIGLGVVILVLLILVLIIYILFRIFRKKGKKGAKKAKDAAKAKGPVKAKAPARTKAKKPRKK
ncbi:MAG: bifunctional metallophosphatase/5'-nucleotidase [Deltaproteobacteria bacterium]|nr:bifunctional metallophosphatase/5'-nucleotidase [Candidatus Zymogenaceae bacterium]